MKLKVSNPVRYLLALVAFGAGLFLGTIVAQFRRSEQPAPVPGDEVANVAPNRDIDATPTFPSPTETPPKEPFYMSRLKALREASELLEEEKNLFIRLSRPVDRERLNPDFVMLFGLTPHEVERLVAAMEVAKQKLSELEARHAMIEKEEDGSITVTIPIFPTDGGLVYDEWQQTMRSTLGEQRWSFYTEISRNDVEPSTAFGMFGLQRTEMHVKPNGSPIAQANWSPGSAGGSHKVVNSNPRMLRKLYPLIHQKLVTGGFLPPEP